MEFFLLTFLCLILSTVAAENVIVDFEKETGMVRQNDKMIV